MSLVMSWASVSSRNCWIFILKFCNSAAVGGRDGGMILDAVGKWERVDVWEMGDGNGSGRCICRLLDGVWDLLTIHDGWVVFAYE